MIVTEQEEQAKEAIELMSSEIQPPDVSLIRGAVRRRQRRRRGIRYAAAMGIVVVAIAGGLSAAVQLNDRDREVVTVRPAQQETGNDETTTSLAAVTTTVSSSSSISDDAQGTWGLESITSGSEQIEFAELGTRTLGNVPAWLELNESGGLSGEVLCNDFQGSYEFDGQLLRTSGIIRSLVGCGEGQQIDTLFFDHLSGDPLQVSFTGDDSNIMTWSSTDVELTFIRMSGPSANEPTTTATTTTTSLPELPTP